MPALRSIGCYRARSSRGREDPATRSIARAALIRALNGENLLPIHDALQLPNPTLPPLRASVPPWWTLSVDLAARQAYDDQVRPPRACQSCRALLAAALLMLARVEPANAQLLPCETTSARPPSAVVVNLDKPRWWLSERPSYPDQVVTVEAGERLCLAGVVLDTGKVRELRSLEAGDSTPVLLSIELLPGQRGVSLLVRHTGTSPLRYQLLHMPRPDVALPDSQQLALDGRTSIVRFPAGADRVGLARLWFDREGPEPNVRRQPSPQRVRARARVRDSRFAAAMYPLYGRRWLDLDDVDRALAANGHAPLQKSFPQYGMGLHGSEGPFRLAAAWATGTVSAAARLGGDDTRVRYSEFEVLGGWNALRAFPLLADVSGGFTSGRLTMNRKLAGCSSGPRDGGDAHAEAWAFVLEHGAETVAWSSRAGLGIGLGYRIGYARQLGGSSWDTRDGAPAAPSLDIGGVRGRLWLGVVVR